MAANLKFRINTLLFIFTLSLLTFEKTYAQRSEVIEKNLKQITTTNDKVIKVLSIDGGGIRGIIPAMILREIEERLKNKKSISECFDVMAGTSTGGIIVLILNTPDEHGKPKYKASDAVNLYENLGPKVFHRSAWHRIMTLNGWTGAKYSDKNFMNNMEQYFGDVQLKDALTEVLIPAYDINRDQTIFFKSSYACEKSDRNFYFKDVARATSSAPTYFSPATIKDLGELNDYTLVDGGIAVNNPSLSASIHALKSFNQHSNFLIISIGTGTNFGATDGKVSFSETNVKGGGKVAWADDIVSVMFHAGNDVVDYLLQNAFVPNTIKKYYRLQVLLSPKNATIDDTSQENIKALKNYAQELIKTHDEEINRIVKILDS